MAATLGVDTIQHTNGTTAVTVGTNGSVTAAGTLGVTGASTLTGNTTVGGTLGVTGVTTLTGNVGIGTSSPSAGRLTLSGVDGGSSAAMYLNNTTATNGKSYSISSGNSGEFMVYDRTSNAYRLYIDSSGKVLVGTTAALSFASSAPIQVLSSGIAGAFKNTTAGSQTISVYNTGNSGTRYLMWFESNASKTHVGSITSNGSATAYNTSSDYRLKENVDYTWDATTRLKQLKPARFNFIADDTNTLVDGFIAHEVSSIVPEAITGAKDKVDDNGDAVMQGIDQSKLVPLLVKTIQELEARITALEA